ncbi:MAG: Eco57I restriction-modification methylase domain-containing protein [Bacteroidales bacterium]|nr:Eco57I restriction-modification methylase domain-containing protein [Bacteroidales bacterium]
MPNLSINGALNKVYLRQKPKTKDFEEFSRQLENLKSSIEKGISLNESEENFKNLINDFLKESFYKGTNLINTKKRIDSAIYKTLDSNSQVQVLIEAKRPGSNEFPAETNLNTKAMQEALLYFLRERVLWKNIDLKHIIITNGFEWFLFDASEFQTHFYNDKKLLNRYDEFEVNPSLLFDKTSDFYKDIAAPFIDKVKTQINYVYFDIRVLSERQRVGVYKLLSPEHLLRKFVCNDSNELNASFYNELLYILGLEEVKNGNRTQICRLEKNRQSASFIENTINQIEDEIPTDERRFEIALSLTITWINRILFLKLLESQLVNYNKGNSEYRFLNSDSITGFDDLHELFFKVLAVPTAERKPDVVKKYKNIPYLNSSLFELTDNERILKISGLRDDKLPLHKLTILRDSRTNKRLDGELPVLEYLFRFLDAYDFGSESDDDSLTRDNQKTLINASVLGLIFEKINGYKDGSFFTPGFITSYICRGALRRSVVQKFNEVKGWNCKNFDELADKDLDKVEANQIINSLRICDPAVGSGHFLVSALNELIAIKADLQVLMLKNGKRLKYSVVVENDELIILDDDGELFEYNPKNAESQLVQESLFEEKRALIENCLFGVDINPNSVNICRLRLWIELLKNAYYKETGEFETLPNIDINIKCGNSLVCYYPVKIGTPICNNSDLKKEIAEYKACVKSYKYENDKEQKKKVKEAISKLKQKIAPGYQLSLELETKDIENNRKAQEMNIYHNSMEWMIEFPEILDDEGIFKGFDAVIGNPPYGVSIKGNYRETLTRTIGKVPDYEIYYYFIAQSRKILKTDAVLSFIIPNTWLFNVYAKDWRSGLFCQWDLLQILDCTKFKIFSEANVRNTIVTLVKTVKGTHIVKYKNTRNRDSFESLIIQEDSTLSEQEIIPMNINWGLAFSLPPELVKIVNKISNSGDKLHSYFPEISQGLIAYDKYQGQSEETIKNRVYHHFEYEDGYKKWLWGEDVKRYETNWNGKEYIDYCSGIANPRQPKYFNGKRILVREITNPSIFANIVTDEMYNDPAIIIVLDSDKYPLEVALAILNSKLATFYHFNHSPKATKGDFPKIIVQDIKDFPLPKLNTKEQQKIIDLVKQIFAAKKQVPQADTSKLEKEIDLLVYHLYGLTFDEVKLIDENVTEEEFATVK